MTDDRRRAGSSAPPPVDPNDRSPSDTLPFAATVTPFRDQVPQHTPGPRPPQGARELQHAATMTPAELPLGSRPPLDDAAGQLPSQRGRPLPYAPTVTPPQQPVGSATLDIRGPSRGGRRSEPPPSGTLDLPSSDRVDAASLLAPGQMIGHFVIRKRLGEGGMGIVVAGHDADLGRPVAIKLVKPEVDHPGYRARLLREAQALARLEHPNVVRVYEVGSDRGRLFVAMELVDGVTLTAWLRAQRRPWREVIAMFLQIGAGLAAVHRAGLVHRDFKPDNVLVDRSGRARVADFGLARFDPQQQPATTGAAPELMSLTRSGMMMGTPGYMAPEQQFGGSVDARADQYSYCVALREALVGKGDHGDPARWGDVPKPIRAALARGAAYEAHERFPSMDALLAALRGKESRRAAVISVAIAAIAVAGGIATTVLVMSARRGGSRPAAPTEAAPAPAPRLTPTPAPAVEPAPAPQQEAEPPRADGAPVEQPKLERRATVPKAQPAPAPAPPAIVAPGSGAPAPAVTRAPRKPEAWPSDPGHLPIVRAVTANLGYDGFDPSITAAAVDKMSGMEQVVGKVKLGMVERRAGRCAAASGLFTEARQVIPAVGREDSVWHSRAAVAQAICAIGEGKVDQANQLAMSGWVEGNQDEIRFLMGLVLYEKGEMRTAQAMFLTVLQSGGPTARAAVQLWLDKTGLTLP